MADGRKRQIALKCAGCRIAFYGRPWPRGRRFCSTHCSFKYDSRRRGPSRCICKTCHKPFRTNHRHAYCSPKCRPSFRKLSTQAGTFHIEGMTPAEFAFRTIMASRGISLRFFNPGSRAFFLNRRAFQLNGRHYTPDFEDPQTGILYEVVGTRQAYHQGRAKIAAFRSAYPDRKLLIVRPDGSPFRPSPRSRVATQKAAVDG